MSHPPTERNHRAADFLAGGAGREDRRERRDESPKGGGSGRFEEGAAGEIHGWNSDDGVQDVCL